MTLRELDGHPLFVRREKLKKYEALRPGAAQQGLVRWEWGLDACD